MSDNILPGYQLHVSSWENDADARQTQIISGLTKEDVKFYVELAKRFESCNCKHWAKVAPPNNLWYLGNDFQPEETLVKLVVEVLESHPPSAQLKAEWESFLPSNDEEESYVGEQLQDLLLGHPQSDYYYGGDGPFCRVVDKIEVFHVPMAIENVTEEFVAS